MKDKTSMYILSIVGIVALVGMVVYLSGYSGDITGQAYLIKNAEKRAELAAGCGNSLCSAMETYALCPEDCDEDEVDLDEDGLRDSYEDAESWAYDSTNPDSDGDGLEDGREYAWGTFAHQADTDGDGYDDGLEVRRGTDPLDISDYPEDRRVSVSSSEPCTDSDEGRHDYRNYGEVTVDGEVYGDYCISGNDLKEYYCVGDDVGSLQVGCYGAVGSGYDCVDGACVRQW